MIQSSNNLNTTKAKRDACDCEIFVIAVVTLSVRILTLPTLGNSGRQALGRQTNSIFNVREVGVNARHEFSDEESISPQNGP